MISGYWFSLNIEKPGRRSAWYMKNGTGTILSCVGDINKGTYQVAYHITIAVGEQLLRRAKGHYVPFFTLFRVPACHRLSTCNRIHMKVF